MKAARRAKAKHTVTRKRKNVADEAVAADDSGVVSGAPENVAAFRLRMDLVGRLLRTAFEELHGSDHPDRMGRGVYLTLMGQVFEALDGLSQAVPLDALVQLSKVVAEQRRAETNARKVAAGAGPGQAASDGTEEEEGFDSRRLPARFGEMVRQVYGTSFAGDVSAEVGQEDSEAGE